MSIDLTQARREDSEALLNALVSRVLLKERGWFVNFSRESDFGVDLQAQLAYTTEMNELELSNKIISFQLKSGNGYLRASNNEEFICANFGNLEKVRKWFKIWFKLVSPVYIVWLSNPRQNDPEKVYWLSVKDFLSENPDFLSNGSSCKFKFPIANRFTPDQMDNVRKKHLKDEIGKKIREIPRDLSNEIKQYLESHEIDTFNKNPFNKFFKKEFPDYKKEVKYCHWGLRTGIPKKLISEFKAEFFISDFERNQIFNETLWLTEKLIENIPNHKIVKKSDLISFITNLGLSKDENYIFTTPKGRVCLSTYQLVYYKNNSVFLKKSDIKVRVLRGPFDLRFGTFILCLGYNLGYRKSILKPECRLRTFDPTDKSVHLFDIDPLENFEVEFNHIVEYEFYTQNLDKALFTQIDVT